MSELVPALKDTLFSPTYEIVAEYAEIGIDALLENEVLKEIPVVGTLSSLCKVGYNLHERNLIKQTLAFITEFNSSSISQEKLDEHREKLEENPKEAEKELSRVLIILGKQVEQIQSQVLGSFYAAYIKGAISWEKFCELSEANRRMFISDYQILDNTTKEDFLKLYNQFPNKQIFISLDQYLGDKKDIDAILFSSTRLVLSEDSPLFGKDWRK